MLRLVDEAGLTVLGVTLIGLIGVCGAVAVACLLSIGATVLIGYLRGSGARGSVTPYPGSAGNDRTPPFSSPDPPRAGPGGVPP